LAGGAILQSELTSLPHGAALATTSFFGIIGLLQNLFLLRLGYDAATSA